jgi:hypothetical protein
MSSGASTNTATPVDDATKILAAADRVYIEFPFFPR